MNFSYGIIAAVGVLVAVSVGFIFMEPDELVKNRTADFVIAPPALLSGGGSNAESTKDPSGADDPQEEINIWAVGSFLDTILPGDATTTDQNVTITAAGDLNTTEPDVTSTVTLLADIVGLFGSNGTAASQAGDTNVVGAGGGADSLAESLGGNATVILIPAGTYTPECANDNTCFLPSSATVQAGELVVWSNVDTASHTVTSGSPRGEPLDLFDTDILFPGDTFAYTFEDEGTYDYYCNVHPWMVGTVIVTA